MKLKKILFVPDVHHPYHDPKAWKLLLKAGKHFKPDTIVTLGDFCDFYSVSSHSKDPSRKNDLEWEVGECLSALDDLESLGAKQQIFVSGNHENRLERYLMDKAPELFGVVRIPDLLQLKQRGWTYVPYKNDIKLGKLYITHDVGSAGRNAIFVNLSTYQHNVIGGHTHRMAYVVEGNAKGTPHVSAMFGWLGDWRKTDYMHRIKASRDWSLGFGTGYMTKEGVIYITPHPIVDYTCVIEGKLIQ